MASQNKPLPNRPHKKRTLRPDHPDAAVRRGPRTEAGMRRVAQNACRHGLSVAAAFEASVAAEIEALARRICGDAAGPDAAPLPPFALDLARRVAQAQFDLKRVRLARHRLLVTNFADPRYRTRKGLMARIRMLGKAGDLLLRGIPVPPDMARAILDRPRGAEKMAVILADFTKELAAMDRYERRARSRRRRAIRAFDDAVTETVARRSAARADASRARADTDAAVSAKQFPATSPMESTPREDAAVSPQRHRVRPEGRKAPASRRRGALRKHFGGTISDKKCSRIKNAWRGRRVRPRIGTARAKSPIDLARQIPRVRRFGPPARASLAVT
jgi:hypothetical protein